MINKAIKYFIKNPLVTGLIFLSFIFWGIVTSPFQWIKAISSPVPVDAIPDIGENQQIVFTKWSGRSPQDMEDQITYPLTTTLLGVPGVKTIRSTSGFGFSNIYIIFNEEIDFYWSRSRILEKLNALPTNILPEGVKPSLGPDATGLGQIFWYTLEGRDSLGNVTGGWDLEELRTIQDFYVKYSLNAIAGVSEVASIGGYVKEYQVDIDPIALKKYGISLNKVVNAVRMSNREIGAKTIEINQVEYIIRGLGYVKKIEDIEKSVVDIYNNVPIRVKDIAVVNFGPANRRGVLDKNGAEVVGGVVVSRYGSNPMQVIQNIKKQIKDITLGLPKKVLSDGTVSKLTIVPFYDRSKLIKETLNTLEEALSLEVLITIIVVIVMVFNIGASILISSLLPIAILMAFIFMKYFGVDANIVALSGIAIAIGTMVDLGIILSENIIKHTKQNKRNKKSISDVIYSASSEVSSAIITAVSTTIVSFIPVFFMENAEGKLFKPLAFTKTFALFSSLIVALLLLPMLSRIFFGTTFHKKIKKNIINYIFLILGIAILFLSLWAGVTIICLSIAGLLNLYVFKTQKWAKSLPLFVCVISADWILSERWSPLGIYKGIIPNFMFVTSILILILGVFYLIEKKYKQVIKFGIRNKKLFWLLPFFCIVLAINIWFGFDKTFNWMENGFKKIGIHNFHKTSIWMGLKHTFPGIGKEFMPSLDEGSFLLMPSSMPHSGVEQNKKFLQQLDLLVSNIPEIIEIIGKLGRIESALDPAPISMFENIIHYKSEFIIDENTSYPKRFKINDDGHFILKNGDVVSNDEAINQKIKETDLIEDDDGHLFRNWRSHIKSKDDIWNEIVKVSKIPGITSAPKLQPIETRLIMLQTGMRAPIGIKVFGPDLKTIEEVSIKLEKIIKTVPSVIPETVFADRLIGKPYLNIEIDRNEISRYGLHIYEVQEAIEIAMGGKIVSTTVEGRERFSIRVRYPRELRDNINSINKIYIQLPNKQQIQLEEIARIKYVRGPQVIKSENNFLLGYVLLDKKKEFSEVGVVENIKKTIQKKIKSGEFIIPPGVHYKFSGTYENQIRAEKRLKIIIPIVLLIIFLILYFQFNSVPTSLIIFTGITITFSGGFILIWLYNQEWFLNFSIYDKNLRDLFQISTINLSTAVWIGFIALFGIATDDGVLIATYIKQNLEKYKPTTFRDLKNTILLAGMRRIKPALMTLSTTIIALLPILTSTGKGSDIMVPMAIPIFGGMIMAILTCFVTPILYYIIEEKKLKKKLLDDKN